MKGNVFGAVCLALGALTAQAERPAEPCDIRPIQRTMKALEESTAKKPAQVRVLFYGQSIVAQGWGNQIIADWRKRYPTAKISSACPAIGGYTSPGLSRTAYADLYPYYPDILFFHVYGPLDKYEEIIRETRSRTTAEIVLWSSHMAAKDDPAAMLAAADERTKGIADIARRYNCTFVDLNRKWAKNLVDKGLEPKALLRDTIHLSKEAGALDLYAGFIAEELKRLPGCSGEKTSGMVETIGADDGRVVRKPDGSVELSFAGNRVVGEVSVPGGAKVFLDGRPAEEVPEMWYMTRCSASPMWMPAVNRVQWRSCPVAEDWTLTYLEGSDPDGDPILFEAEGSVSGKCGRGSTAEDFLASNGRVFIEKGDFGNRQYRQFKKKVKVGQTVKWSARPQFALPCKAEKAGQRLVLVQGCAVGRHVLRIVPEGGKGVAFASFTVHCPPDPAQFASATGDRSAATFIPSQRDMLENDPQAAAAKAAGERRLKVLAIGNSFSASMMGEFPAAAAAYPGVKLAVANMMIGGCTLDRHWANVEKASDPEFRPYSISKNYAFDKETGNRLPKKANIPEMLKADRWDVVTIQQGSAMSAFPESYEPYAGKLIAKIRELAPQAEIWIQETWSYAAYCDRLVTWKMTPATMHQALRDAYAGIAKKYGLKTIPMGDAVALYRERLPVDYGTLLTKDEIAALKPPATIDFHGDVAGSSSWQENGKLKRDFIHLNAEGRYLQGCVWLAALFDADLTKLTYEPGIKDFKEKAKLMRECAAEAVARLRTDAFKAELETVHRPGVRDPALKPAADEFAFADGVRIAVCTEDARVRRGAADFADYLVTSMGVRASVADDGRGAVTVALDGSLAPRSCEIAVTEAGVAVKAADGRAAMQALFHLEDLMNLRRAPFLKFGTERRREKYEARMVHSGWAVDRFPDGYLGQIAHAGFDSILFYIDRLDVTRAGKTDIAALIDAAEAWGLGAFLYSSLNAQVHPDDPKAAETYDATYGAVGRAYPKARGIILVPESCWFPSKDPRTSVTHEKGKHHPSRFPCSDYPQWCAALERAYKAGNPDGEFIFWTYNFCWSTDEERCSFIRDVSPTTAINLTFAVGGGRGVHRSRTGYDFTIEDYSICEPGPSSLFTTEADAVRRRGLRLYTMVNTGGRTWDFGCCPYEPVPQAWKRRYDAIEKARNDYPLVGLMESHHYGFAPNFIAELSKESFTEGGIPFERHIRMIAARDFGEAHADEVVAIWADLSEAIRDYAATGENQYGPFRTGPAFPFNCYGEPIKPTDIPGWSGWICNPNYGWNIPWKGGESKPAKLDLERHRHEIRLFRPAGERFVAGAAKLRAFAGELAGWRRRNALREAGVAEYIGRSFITCGNVKEATLAERAGDRETVLRLAREEYANAKAALPLVDFDSRLGWEPSMKYRGARPQIEWKLRRMEKLYGVGGAR